MFSEFSGLAQSFTSFLKKNERSFFYLLIMVGLIRLFLLIAAFPFFNNVDEHAHFDTVVKYARGYTPHKDNNHYDVESATLIARYDTPEYLFNQDVSLSLPITDTSKKVDEFTSLVNHEAFSPPIYYLIAGSWYNIGKLLHLQGGRLLYWLRFLNLPIYALLLWVSYRFCKFLYPESPFLSLGMTLLLAFFPQDVFYSINNDVLSPLFFLCGLFLLLRLLSTDYDPGFYFLSGCVVAATVLVKLSNLPSLLIFGAIFLAIIKEHHRANRLIKRIPHILVFLCAALGPFVMWASRNYFNLGDFLGTAEKLKTLGWAPKPLGQLLDHPIFTFYGIFYFLSETTKTFWRGEFVWHLEKIASPSADMLYVATSGLFILAGTIYTIRDKTSYLLLEHRFANYLNIVIPLIYLLFLALLSIRYDFGDCWYPSRDIPFLTSGRLILGMLIPFLLLYLKGIEFCCAKINSYIHPIFILLPFVIYSTFMQIYSAYACGVFASPYNFFHLN